MPAWRSLIRRGLQARLLQALPFALTGAQQRVLDEVERDLASARRWRGWSRAMSVAARPWSRRAAAARAIGSGAQVAFMAPTELLAEQHARSLPAWFEPARRRGQPADRLAAGARAARGAASRAPAAAHSCASARMRCSSRQVSFSDLALAIIDEQHRFGVQQRLQLAAKGGIGTPDARRTS